MKNLLLFAVLVSLPLLLGGCGEKIVNVEELEEREYITYLKGSDTPYTGKVFGLYENGQKELEINYKDGKQDGLKVYWYENGKKREEVNFKDGKQDGLWVWWYENGQKASESNYKNYKEDGLYVSWRQNGQKRSEVSYKDGKKVEGSEKYWNSKGEPVDSLTKKQQKLKEEVKPKENSAENQLATKKSDQSLYDATLLGETEKVKKAIADGADVNTKGALHNAVVASLDSGDNEIVEMFISNGANVNAKDDKGLTALDIIKSLSDIAAVSKNLRAALGKTDDDIPVADLLRKHGAKTSEELKASD